MGIRVAVMCLALFWDSLVSTYWLNNFFAKEEMFWDKKKVPSELGQVPSVQGYTYLVVFMGHFGLRIRPKGKESSEYDFRANGGGCQDHEGNKLCWGLIGSKIDNCVYRANDDS